MSTLPNSKLLEISLSSSFTSFKLGINVGRICSSQMADAPQDEHLVGKSRLDLGFSSKGVWP